MAKPSENRPTDAKLRSLYVDQGWSAERIADSVGVRKITVLRWLGAAGVERRPSGRGLANRGASAPSPDELRRMVHEDHLSFRDIAARYGVHHTAVPQWLNAYGIERPGVWDTRRRGKAFTEPSEQELRSRLGSGESISSISKDFDVSTTCIRARCDEYGIEVQTGGWQPGRKFLGQDGHELRSTYEQRVCDWLHSNGVTHEVEPAYPWDRRYRADFKVGDAYVEVWGVTSNDAYKKRKAMKIARCAEHGVELIQINHWQFAAGRKWWKPLLHLHGVL